MSVLYRALWTDATQGDVAQHLDDLKLRCAAWATESAEPGPLPEGKAELSLSLGRRRQIDHRALAEDAGRQGFELVTRDQKDGEATVWATVIRVVADAAGVHSLIENRMESDDLAMRVAVGRPKVVHELLVVPGKPALGSSKILLGAVAIPADGITVLTDILGSPSRALPVIVCSEPGGYHDGTWQTWANRIAARVEGIAAVITLDTEAVTAFREEFGDLAIWGGGIRVYAPTAVTSAADGWRHRYYLRSRIEQATTGTIDRIVYSVAQLSTRRRIPEVFSVFAARSTAPAKTLDGLLSAEELATEREQLEFALDLEVAERSELEKELAKANGHLARLKDELIHRNLGDILWGTQHEVTASIPDEVQDTSEAVLAAQTYLSRWLALPDSAMREIDDIDTAPTAYAWGNTTWRGLRALAAYAEDRAAGWNKGGFWEWCLEGGPLTWPATTKKLSMSEGETVQNSTKLKRTRVFEVDSALGRSGEITMLAHLKISEGGGNLAPRVYFHDDTGGATGKVHVGLVGPHYLVPNKSTS